MSVEMQMLLWACALGLVQIGIAATAGTMQRGLKWNAGARDEALGPLTGVAGRLDRAQRNFLETFPFFAVAVLALVSASKTGAHTAQGAQLYFWARVAYVPLYALGIAYVRTLAWAVSIYGLLVVLLASF
jgi:uncharacterized MAPEG superfamily protein